ncbi:MAG: hypothetical protein A3G24_24095 [Betaproteobacteria bacterium RIFCSPLOWO2_12_FULL_62_13]|nr:MAG: hypothetical protein A3G24_24095 [Betaproteobacteria bacterium RIFCSPLOWO2_12_FULL_62_13]
MKVLNATLLAAAVLAAAMASTSAFADGGRRHGFRQFQHSKQFHHPKRFQHFRPFHHRHRRAHLGIFIGAPLAFGPWWYAPPSYPATVVVPASPPVYIEQGQAAPAAQDAQAYWYYCPDSKSYYPYVDRCAGPWQRVAPQPPPSQ